MFPEATAGVLVMSLPVGVAGVVFLSGGLEDRLSTAYLNALNVLKSRAIASVSNPNSRTSDGGNVADQAISRLPPLSFSFGRGLQGDAMSLWVKGDVDGAKEAFRKRAGECWGSARGELGVDVKS